MYDHQGYMLRFNLITRLISNSNNPNFISWFPTTTDQTKAPTTRKPTRPPRTPRPTKHPTPIPTPNTPQLNQNGLVIAVDDTISLQSGTTEAFIAVLENDTGSNLIVRAITAQPTNGQCSLV